MLKITKIKNSFKANITPEECSLSMREETRGQLEMT